VVALTGREYYEGLCFKAVNQCIGRVIRHKGDYAVVILVDTRWVSPGASGASGPSTAGAALTGGSRGGGGGGGGGGYSSGPISKLPGWIQRSYVGGNGQFGEGFKRVAEFFRGKRQQQV
jgi:chromosome transmission fidelity protein 1